jgi:GTP-binding protein
MIKIREARFIKSASKIEESPNSDLVEIAILGRSNVGKSSTINSLTKTNNLAKSSNTPGKTRLINFFQINFLKDEVSKKFMLVDLPGVGYAKVSKSMKRDWEQKLQEFIKFRTEIELFIYLIDSRHPNLDIDKGVIDYLLSLDKNILVVYTKTDKLKKSEFHRLKAKNRTSIFLSNLNSSGVSELQNLIFDLVPEKD